MSKIAFTSNLETWLSYLEGLHNIPIDLTLERIAIVRDRLGLKPVMPIVTIGGTNGKGSTTTMLATILVDAGFRVGLYTSPHLLHYNERISVDLLPVTDEALVDAFSFIENARKDISLTYFEFATLAAVQIFIQQKVDIIILEVGLGGRLDATNIFDPDIAAVVSVDMDHQAYLGNTREKIALEKAGIFRAGRPALCADPDPPQSLIDYAREIGAKLELFGQDFGYHATENQWSHYHGMQKKHALPYPALRGKMQLLNASLVLAILDHLREKLPLSLGNIKTGLLDTELPGRFQVLPGRPTVVLDVGHNVHAAKALRQNLEGMGFYEKTYAVFGMLEDKDSRAVINLLKDRIDVWFIGPLKNVRSLAKAELESQFSQAENVTYQSYVTINEAYQEAYRQASINDRIVVFGSFYTVSEVLNARSR